MISLVKICLTLLAFYRLQMSTENNTDTTEKPVLKNENAGRDMRYPINSTDPDMIYYKNIFLKASILAFLENPNVSIHRKIDTIEDYETKYNNRSKMSYNLHAGMLIDDWEGF